MKILVFFSDLKIWKVILSNCLFINYLKTSLFISPAITIFLLQSISSCQFISPSHKKFDSQMALNSIATQVSFGPRITGSQANLIAGKYIMDELKKYGWETYSQELNIKGHTVKNIIGKYGEGNPWIILGAHYDTRIYSDRDEDVGKKLTPVPGANDGASGVSILLELARIIPPYMKVKTESTSEKNDTEIAQIWLVFFDAEDNGNIPGWDWILGSTAFVDTLIEHPDAVIIVDMVGDQNLKIYQEKNSNQELKNEIWAEAEKLDYSDYFIPIDKYSILDDHIPFIEAGIPAVDIIDIEYPYWHTTQDTLDKISSKSLMIVGDTLLQWVLNKRFE